MRKSSHKLQHHANGIRSRRRRIFQKQVKRLQSHRRVVFYTEELEGGFKSGNDLA